MFYYRKYDMLNDGSSIKLKPEALKSLYRSPGNRINKTPPLAQTVSLGMGVILAQVFS
jgi:hypothetical protein